MKSLIVLALLSTASAIRITQDVRANLDTQSKASHACDYITEDGDEISTSLMPEYVQLKSSDEDDSVEGARAKWA
jgi:hypothetical protein